VTVNPIYFAPFASVLALVFAALQAAKIKMQDQGTEQMQEIAQAVRTGAKAYLARQYKGVACFFGAMFLLLLLLANRGYISIFVPFAFLTGGFLSGLAGFICMSVSTGASARTAQAAQESLNRGLQVAFGSGTVMGMVVVGLGLLDLSLWFFLLDWYYTKMHPVSSTLRVQYIASTMLNFGMGASSMALFARVGGGIFTKAADVGADLVGKVEAGIPEDDPRNPAVIADNVGDNVGDVAGMGADLYESYVGSIVATIALAVAAQLKMEGVIVPLAMAALGLFASILGTFVVRTKEDATQGALLGAIRKGTYLSATLMAISSYFLITRLLGQSHLGIYFSVLVGLIAGVGIGYSTEYFTSVSYKPTRNLAGTALTGPATLIIGGLSVGMLSTLFPILIIASSVLLSFLFSGGGTNFRLGLYGVGISAVSMLSTLGITLATDAYGPVADNAGGIAQMAGLPDSVRRRTDALDSLGNTTAATGKGFAIGSAALTALALIAAYRDQLLLLAKAKNISLVLDLSILNPKLLVGLFIGGMLPFLFSALTMSAVGKAAQEIVLEVRRQFREIPGLMEGTAKADYAKCVDICTRSSLREMILPALVAVASPIIVGLIVGVEGVMGLLAGSTVTGFMLAVMMANSGGAWDNAKKYIEEGNFGGKGSEAHLAAVVGDTVGDPFKDTSGPALNILIKLVSMVSVVFASFILLHSLL
jgi:K(+)-stimulated pyrophosphate-energized sodium pump